MTIEWFDPTTGIPTATLAPYGITLSTASATYFLNTNRVKLGIDAEAKKVYVKACLNGEDGFSIPSLNDQRKTIRISCKEFIQFLCMRFDLSLDSSHKFYATYDSTANALVINLSRKVASPQRKK